MKPTQAQIEAALAAYSNTYVYPFDMRVVMKAALTAAAQVGEQDEIVRVASMIPNTINATIERCAQVAERYDEFVTSFPEQRKRLAAAIHNLKEQP